MQRDIEKLDKQINDLERDDDLVRRSQLFELS